MDAVAAYGKGMDQKSIIELCIPRLLTTINKQESVMVDTRIFTIYQIVILEYWRQLITS